MAITVHQQPQLHTPAYNDQIFNISSNNTGQPNFKYVVDIVCNGLTRRLKYNTHPTTGRAYFNIKRVVESHVFNLFNPLIDEIGFSSEMVKSVRVNFFEEYGTTPSVSAQLHSLTYYVWNASLDEYTFNNYLYTNTLTGTKLLSDAEKTLDSFINNFKTVNHDINSRYNFIFWHRGFGLTSDAPRFIIECYNDNQAIIQTTKITNNYNDGSPVGELILYANVSNYGMNLLETNNSGDIISKSNGSLDIIPMNTRWCFCYFASAIDVPVSEVKCTVFNNICTKFGSYNLHFLNTLGGWDVINLSMLSEQNLEKQTTTYEKDRYSIVSNNFVYNTYDSNTVNISTVVTESWKLQTNWISEKEALMLKSLFSSPHVVLEFPDNSIKSVKIKNNSYDIMNKNRKKLFNYIIDLELEYKHTRQRG